MALPTLDQLFQLAIDKRASDLHIVANLPPILRIDGTLVLQKNFSVLEPADTEKVCLSFLNDLQRRRFLESRDLDVGYQLKDGTRFRINLFWEKDQIGLVARVISSRIPTMEELLMPNIVYDLIRLDQGLILVTGPTGCGKSTSLAAMINLVNEERSANIVTLEDPIEFIYTPKKCIIEQRQLGSDMLTFEAGLKHVVRQDPNVILVGEMRDLETIASTITLAETGHLVLATLHTFNAAQTVDRIIDVFPPHQQNQVRSQLSLFLKGIISQRLLPRAKGGRVAAREVLINTPAIANLIRENKIPQIKTALQTSAHEGMMTMDQNIKVLFENKEVTREVALAHMVNPESLH
ncbi:MAG: PilT/PilU family type 4a pilus ATPase [bacterium]